MRPIYHLGIALYGATIRASAFLGNQKARSWVEGRRNWEARLKGILQAKPGNWILVHCASLGEFEQGRPLIEAIRQQYPDYRILLTFFSPSGYEIRKHYPAADHVEYLPLDTASAARRFVGIVQPTAAFFIKYEFWLNLLHALRERKVPTFLVSGIFRPGQIFFRWYGGTFRRALRAFTRLFVQDLASFDLLRAAGVPESKLIVAGDTRFDRVVAIASGTSVDPTLGAWCGQDRILVAGSTWPEDEQVLLPALADWLPPDVRLLIAPHEIDEASVTACIGRLQAVFGETSVVRYTRLGNTSAPSDHRILLLDTMGHLSSAYRTASIAYVGGGFGKGIHNVLEAAVWGVPVLFGPHYRRFREARELLIARGAVSVRSVEELHFNLRHFLLDEHARSTAGKHAAEYVRSQSGATGKILFHLGSEGEQPLFR
jgi:3-deoxy-D-manno-octulosonic-acid transferase